MAESISTLVNDHSKNPIAVPLFDSRILGIKNTIWLFNIAMENPL